MSELTHDPFDTRKPYQGNTIDQLTSLRRELAAKDAERVTLFRKIIARDDEIKRLRESWPVYAEGCEEINGVLWCSDGEWSVELGSGDGAGFATRDEAISWYLDQQSQRGIT